ncbi:MAG TPA: ATP-binding protein [Beijerinckiaceae bacterium]|nr:ATP-binding protein [Beijerinckiaceae bacterium]
METLASLGGASAWLAPLGALAATLLVVTVMLLRDHLRLEQHAVALEGHIERLQDRVWQLAESEEQHRSLIETQLDFIVLRDPMGRILFANEAYSRLLGRPRQDLIGSRRALRAVESGPVHTRADGARLVDEAIATGDGVRWIAWVETAARAPGGAPAILRLGREVTDRVVSERALEEARSKAEAASEAKSRFLATVSHEFRTPLNGILGMTDLILDTPLSPEQTTYAHAIKTSGEAFLSLIDEILDFSKIEAGRIDIVAAPFDLHALVEGVVELLAPKAQGKGVEISAFVAAGVPRRVVGDGDRLRQVLVNLAGNAVKFTDIGGIGVVVSAEADRIVIEVRDTGPGIPAERIPSVYDEFEQGDGSPSRRHGGAGLGLAITRRIVEGMGGEIALDSRVGHGTTFRVALPLPAADASGTEAADETDLTGQRVLIVAHSPFEAPFLARRLEAAGAAVTLVATPGDALAKIAVSAWDHVVADYALGDDAVRAIAKEARLARIGRSLVLLSPFERRDFGPPSAAGFDTYLVKPVRARSLFERLTKPLAARSEGDGSPRPAASPAGQAGARAKAPRVLLAEDNEINALLAIKSLEKLGAVVDWAKDGHEALALAEASFSGIRKLYDLVLMDIRMPGLDGHDTTRRIRQLERALGRPEPIRVIALTANALREDEQSAREAGLDGFLAKPFQIDALTNLLAVAEAPLARAS